MFFVVGGEELEGLLFALDSCGNETEGFGVWDEFSLERDSENGFTTFNF